MSAREMLSRSGGRSEPEVTQPLDLGGLAEDHQQTVVVATEPPVQQLIGEGEDVDPAVLREREREQRRAEREQALGIRRKSDEPGEDQLQPLQRGKPTTDKFLGSISLFVLRIVTAVIIGLHGFAKMLDIAAVERMLANTVIPEPVIMSYVLTGAEIAIALALIFGLMTRLAGLGLATIGIGALVFVHWISNPFTGNQMAGELELLLGGVGLLFLCLGGGGWSVDRAFRRRSAEPAVL